MDLIEQILLAGSFVVLVMIWIILEKRQKANCTRGVPKMKNPPPPPPPKTTVAVASRHIYFLDGNRPDGIGYVISKESISYVEPAKYVNGFSNVHLFNNEKFWVVGTPEEIFEVIQNPNLSFKHKKP